MDSLLTHAARRFFRFGAGLFIISVICLVPAISGGTAKAEGLEIKYTGERRPISVTISTWFYPTRSKTIEVRPNNTHREDYFTDRVKNVFVSYDPETATMKPKRINCKMFVSGQEVIPKGGGERSYTWTDLHGSVFGWERLVCTEDNKYPDE